MDKLPMAFLHSVEDTVGPVCGLGRLPVINWSQVLSWIEEKIQLSFQKKKSNLQARKDSKVKKLC